MLRVLDLFSGLGGWTSGFDERWEVVTVDMDERFGPTLVRDLTRMTGEESELSGPWDLIVASPPCAAFSPMRAGRNWNDVSPRTPHAWKGLKAVIATRRLIETLEPTYFIIENPRGKLRNLPIMDDLERREITLCQYGRDFMKPTDLWGGFPEGLVLRPPCKRGDPCHVSSPRGSHIRGAGIQGLVRPGEGTDEVAMIPRPLSADVAHAVEGRVGVAGAQGDDGW